MNQLNLWRQCLILASLLITLPALAQVADDNQSESGEAPVTLEAPDTRASISVEDSDGITTGLSETPADTTLNQAQGQDAEQDQEADLQTEAQPATPLLPHDLSPWGMFIQADWVVKAVMIGLALASVVTWTVLVAKTRELHVLMRRQKQTLGVVSNADSLKAAHQRLGDISGNTILTRATADELRLSASTLADAEGVKERVASRLERLEAASSRKITKGTSVLATIGATAPFVGLFGTVWGIMNSFIGISQAQTTNLAVVAPGIAEALLATALGLVAAIPAVVIYNHFARQIAAYKALVGDTSAAILRLVSRDLSRFAMPGQAPRDSA